MGMYLLIAARNLLQARRRSFLLGLVFGFVMILLVFLLSLSNGITDNMISSGTILSTGHVNVAGFYKASQADAAPLVTNASEVRKIIEENTPGLAYVLDRGRGWAKVISETGSQFAGITGIDPKEETHLAKTLVLAKESSYRDGGGEERKGDLSKLGLPGTVVLFASQAKKLEVRVGDALTLTSLSLRGSNNSADVTVVAICEDIGLLSTFSMFTSKQTGLDLYQLKPDTSGALQVYLKDIADSDNVMEHLRGVFEKKGYRLMDHDANPFFVKIPTVQGDDWTGQKLDITTWHDEVVFLAKIVYGLNMGSFILILVLVGVIAVGIMNTMWTSVRERTGEIGTLRAVGMQKTSVLTMFILEAMLLGFAATTVGALVGCGFVELLELSHIPIPWDAARILLISNTLHLLIIPWQVFAAVGVFTLVAGIAALWPALSAAAMQPVTAIQTVE
jgi:putative ABC transport system permease protein